MTEVLKDILDKTGNKSNNSTSKIKKIIATKKNRKENGERLSSFVENPHSKGLPISRSNNTFWERKSRAKRRTTERAMLAKKNKIILNIAF